MSDTTIRDQISEDAIGPLRVSVDGQSVDRRPISEQIAADRYIAGLQAATKKKLGLRIVQINPGGPV